MLSELAVQPLPKPLATRSHCQLIKHGRFVGGASLRPTALSVPLKGQFGYVRKYIIHIIIMLRCDTMCAG